MLQTHRLMSGRGVNLPCTRERVPGSCEGSGCACVSQKGSEGLVLPTLRAERPEMPPRLPPGL